MRIHPLLLATVTALLTTGVAWAQTAPVEIRQPWARATVPGQSATGVFARVTAREAARLTGGSSPLAAVVEIHEMKMDGNVMRMRALEAGLALPAGRAVDLKPGGYHVMLMDLKRGLAPGETIPITLVIETAGGQRERLEVKTSVRPLGVTGAAPAADKGHAHKH